MSFGFMQIEKMIFDLHKARSKRQFKDTHIFRPEIHRKQWVSFKVSINSRETVPAMAQSCCGWAAVFHWKWIE